jgi:hypothetical protein
MAFETFVFAWLMAQPMHVTDLDEPEFNEPDRLSRMSQIAEAVTIVGDGSRITVATLLVTMKRESAFRWDVQSGNCPSASRPKSECDGGAARGLAQLHRPSAYPKERWMSWAGPEYLNLVYSLTQAKAMIDGAFSSCRSLEGAISRYATGNLCYWSGAQERADEIRALAARIR